MQGNMKTAPAEFDVTFDFAIYLCSYKYDRKIERSKNLPKCFSPMVICIFAVQNLCCFHVANVVADGKNYISFSIDTSCKRASALPKNCVSIFI